MKRFTKDGDYYFVFSENETSAVNKFIRLPTCFTTNLVTKKGCPVGQP